VVNDAVEAVVHDEERRVGRVNLSGKGVGRVPLGMQRFELLATEQRLVGRSLRTDEQVAHRLDIAEIGPSHAHVPFGPADLGENEIPKRKRPGISAGPEAPSRKA
jgi:hypothetical protein